jgi:hypothetical protein
MPKLTRRPLLLVPMVLAAIGLAGCSWVEINPKSVSWTEGEKAQSRQIGFKNKAPEEYTFKILAAATNEGSLVKVDATNTTCKVNAEIMRRGECVAILVIDQKQPWEKRTVKFEIEGEVVNGRYKAEKGKASVSVTTK